MTRRGKIARLPQPIREQVNQRLENGEEGKQNVRRFEPQAALQESKMEPKVRMPRPEAGITDETLAQIEKALNLF